MKIEEKKAAAREYLERHFAKHGFRISGSLHRPIMKIVEVIGLDYVDAAQITRR